MKDLTLEQAVTKCRGLEAAKISRKDIQGSPDVNLLRSRPPLSSTSTCAGCGGSYHDKGRKKCPAYNLVCHNRGKTGHFRRVCRQKPASTRPQHGASPQTNTLTTILSDLPLVQLSNLGKGSITPAPTVRMHVTTRNGQADVSILPDSGADICAAGPLFVAALGEHMDNFAHSDVAPRAVNGATLHLVGKSLTSHSTSMAGRQPKMCTFTIP